MRHAATKHIFSYWRRLRGSELAPERARLNPADIGRYLTDMFLLEKDGTGDFRFRIAGSRICALFGMELRNHSFSGLALPQADADIGEMLAATTQDATPVIAGVSLILTDGMSVDAEMLLLPLLHKGEMDARILGSPTFRTHERLAQGASAALDVLSFRILNDADARFLHPTEPDLPFDARISGRRGHLTVLEGGLQQA